MSILAIKPFVPAGKDYGTSLRFFKELGFQPIWEAEGLAELRLGDGAFILQDFAHESMQQNLMMQVSVKDLDEWWDHLNATQVLEHFPGARAKPPTVYPWGNREVHLIDPAGVCWHFLE